MPALLAGRDLRGTVTTMDALLAQEAVARQTLAQHGHYLMIVKKNQRNLYRAIETLFQTPPVPAQPGELPVYAYAGQKEHGRLEQRTLESLPARISRDGIGSKMNSRRRLCRHRVKPQGS